MMMNEARLGVGLQGLSLGEVAYQNAAAYARERLQGRSLSGAEGAGQAGRPDHRPSRHPPHADDHARLQRGRPRAGAVDRDQVRRRAPLRRRQGAPGGRRSARPDDAGHQGRADRQGLRPRRDGAAGVRRPRLHRRARHEPVRARCPHRHDLRGRQRHPGARPRRPQAGAEWRPRRAGLLQGGRRVLRGKPRRREDGAVHQGS